MWRLAGSTADASATAAASPSSGFGLGLKKPVIIAQRRTLALPRSSTALSTAARGTWPKDRARDGMNLVLGARC